MRSGINENPVVQAALIGVLVLVCGFLLVTRVMGGGSSGDSGDSAAAAPATAESAVPATESAPVESAAVTPAPSESSPESSAPAGAEGETAPATLEAGKGMPQDVVDAYDANDVVVLLVVDNGAIDDKRVEAAAKLLDDRDDVALFETDVKNVADYSQITNGVNLNRTPALIVLEPRDLSEGTPVATVSYGYRSLQSVNQAVEDAKYDGKKTPYYPE